ncbi:MAG: aminotransferase class I/II-fold pyridoxal phosphate-dependent enzyme [Deltaproteobacteria bacterium]|nr:aminotransferase class I/II-fold pyridoxal phosphate-dependent enzyme [Deltaproteobacteria bacterium]
MKVPFIDLKPVATLAGAPALAAWERAVQGTEFVGGPSVAALETELGRRLGARHVVACSSGTDALVVGLQALGIGPGSKVALPNLTFWATYEAVAQLGATPVLVDADAEDLQMDYGDFCRAFERFRFDAAILVHLMGWASPRLGEFRRFCAQAGVALLEDGAQSFGVEVDGESVYQGARMSTLSFYPAKVLGGCMDGGAILTDDVALGELARTLCNHGRAAHYAHARVGWNSRMGGLQAAWLLEMLRHMDQVLVRRRELERAHRERLADLAGLVQTFAPPAGVVGNGYLCVCTLRRHEPAPLAAKLGAAGVGVGRVYPETVAEQPPAREALRQGELARSRRFCAKVMNLPLYFGMGAAELDHVHQQLGAVLRAEE